MKAEEASPGHSDFLIYIINTNASSNSFPNKSPTAEFCISVQFLFHEIRDIKGKVIFAQRVIIKY